MSTTTRIYHSSQAVSITDFRHRQEERYVQLFQNIFRQAPWGETWTEDDVKQNLRTVMSRPSFVGFTALLNKTPVGFVTGYRLFDHVPFTSPFYIDQLFVDDRYQHMGIGRALMDVFIRQVRCLGILLLTLENSPAENFYLKYGFKKFHMLFRIRGKVLLYYIQKIHKEEPAHA